jgi:plasmid stabilization system protein ParE
MSYQLFVRAEVEADLAEAEVWYEQKAEGLGKDFIRVVRDAMRELTKNPLIYRLRHRRLGIRWSYPPRFPYRIVFRIEGESIVVLAVLHAKQHDRHWRTRAKES